MAVSDAAGALIPFGFTALESQIYAYLTADSPATGYRIAHSIGKPVANTYKAIQTLQAKGAIVVEDGESRLCRAVPSDELLGRLEREFELHRAKAANELAKVTQGDADDRVYAIRSRSQALARARTMLGAAKQAALAAGRAEFLDQLHEELTDAAARGAEVAVKTEADLEIARVDVFFAGREDDLLKQGAYFRLVVDGSEFIAGDLGGAEEDAELLWSRSRPLARLIHEGLAAEITLLAVTERIEDGAGPKRLARALTQIKSAGSLK